MSSRGVVIITGASTGIGEACAVALAEKGFRCYAGVRSERAASAISEKGLDGLKPITIDVTRQDTIDSARREIEAALNSDRFAGVVNNAGISVNRPLEFIPLEDLRKQFEVNVVGQVAVAQAFLPLIRKDHGRIINIGSTSGFFSAPLQGPYCASKHAMEAITDVLRMELRPWKIPVVLVQPGAIATPIWEKSLSEALDFMEGAPAQLHEYYDPMIEAVKDYAKNANASAAPTDVVTRAVYKALTVNRPKTRYLIGKNARPEKVLSMLPDRIRDWLIGRELGMKG